MLTATILGRKGVLMWARVRCPSNTIPTNELDQLGHGDAVNLLLYGVEGPVLHQALHLVHLQQENKGIVARG